MQLTFDAIPFSLMKCMELLSGIFHPENSLDTTNDSQASAAPAAAVAVAVITENH